MPDPPLSDDDLHALVDGRLPPDQAASVQRRVDADPVAAATVQAWRAQRESLRAHLQGALHEAPPDSMRQAATHLERRHREREHWTRLGGMAAGLLLAFCAGWLGHGQWQGDASASLAARRGPGGFARQAIAAHVVYAPEVRHPVEVDAAQQDHLVQWLSKRVGRSLRVPQLGSEGFELVGGRLLPAEDGARAQFMFQSAAGERITLYIGALASRDVAACSEFRFVGEGSASSFYWVDEGFGYALAGQLPRQRLLGLAEAVHRQL
jgi:anti-sigma factor RsiW